MPGVTAAAERNWDRWKHDCSGFVHAVASDVGVPLSGTANAMVDSMNRPGSGWMKLGHSPLQATTYANLGFLVVAGLKAPNHGHVVVIVPSTGAHGYPVGYWGHLGGIGRKDATINWAWNHHDLRNVEYFAVQAPGGR